ncbi:MAG: hypothetical protein WDW38_011481 [Sanguina aurantia]
MQWAFIRADHANGSGLSVQELYSNDPGGNLRYSGTSSTPDIAAELAALKEQCTSETSCPAAPSPRRGGTMLPIPGAAGSALSGALKTGTRGGPSTGSAAADRGGAAAHAGAAAGCARQPVAGHGFRPYHLACKGPFETLGLRRERASPGLPPLSTQRPTSNWTARTRGHAKRTAAGPAWIAPPTR